MGMRNGNYRPRSICSCMQTKEHSAVYTPRSLCSCMQGKEHMQLYTDQGAYAAVCRARSLCSCMQTKEPMQLYAGQGAYAAVCRPRSICSCMQGKEHMQLYTGQGAYVAVCRPRSICSCRGPYLSTIKIGQIRSQNSNFKRLSSMIAERRKMRYQHVINWLRCQISFLLLRQSIMAIRGSRSGKKTINIPADFACV